MKHGRGSGEVNGKKEHQRRQRAHMSDKDLRILGSRENGVMCSERKRYQFAALRPYEGRTPFLLFTELFPAPSTGAGTE